MSKAASTDRHIWIDMGWFRAKRLRQLEKQCKVWSMPPLWELPAQKKNCLMVSSHSKRYAQHLGSSKVIQRHPKSSKDYGWKYVEVETINRMKKNVSPSWAACDFQLAIYVVLLSVAPRDETGKLRSCSVQRVMCGCVRVYTPYTTETKKKRVATYAEILKVPFILYIMIYNFVIWCIQ